MIVRGPRPEGNFYILDKRISEDTRLTWAARGLLVFLLGKPDHWQVSPAALVSVTASTPKPTGRDGVYALLGELGKAGYLRREQPRSTDGSMGVVRYIVTESPLTPLPEAAGPDTAAPHTANPTQVSIEGEQGLKVGEGASAKSKTKAPKPEPVGFDFDTGSFFGPICDHFGRWGKAFPAVDVQAEVLRIGVWLMANPANRKSNYLRFITNWLSRAQDKAPRAGNTGAQGNDQQHQPRGPFPRQPSAAEQRDTFMR